MQSNTWQNIAQIGGVILVCVGILGGLVYMGEQQDDKPTDASRLTITAEDHANGPETAKATLIEYADFQCPACGSYYNVVKELKTQYKDDLRIVYRHFPIYSKHPNAEIAGRAAEAASMQGKFWEMYEVLFTQQTNWESNNNPTDLFVGYAQTIGLDVEKFKKDLKDSATRKAVRDDYESGVALGVNSTPTFFLNGVEVAAPNGYNGLDAAIKEAIEKAGEGEVSAETETETKE